MLYREIIAVCSQIHTEHINTAVWAERRFTECTHGGTYSNYLVVNYGEEKLLSNYST
jgi:hypothetical protein